VKFLRHSEARGDYDQVVETLNGTDPHGKQARTARGPPGARLLSSRGSPRTSRRPPAAVSRSGW
jgi:hypothetical protein